MSVDAAAMEAELAAFKDPKLARGLIDSIQKLAPAEGATLMEVCGTHTVAIARNCIRALMTEGVKLSSGPGCPVCVTSNHDIDAVIALARVPEVTIATFGDMTRVPGSTSSLLAERLLPARRVGARPEHSRSPDRVRGRGLRDDHAAFGDGDQARQGARPQELQRARHP